MATWRFLECPECDDSGWTDQEDIIFCGECAGDSGDDVRLTVKKTIESDRHPDEVPDAT